MCKVKQGNRSDRVKGLPDGSSDLEVTETASDPPPPPSLSMS